MSVELDATDLKIVAELQKNARLSNKELAYRVGVAPSTVLYMFPPLSEVKIIIVLSFIAFGIAVMHTDAKEHFNNDRINSQYSGTKR